MLRIDMINNFLCKIFTQCVLPMLLNHNLDSPAERL